MGSIDKPEASDSLGKWMVGLPSLTENGSKLAMK